MPSISGTFPVTNGAEVHLTVEIGDGQLGRSSAAIRGSEVASGSEINETIGTGDALRGEMMLVVCGIKDIRPETNRASARVTLRCGSVVREFTQRDKVTQDGGTIVFAFMIAFK
jgi:hypothetical protein